MSSATETRQFEKNQMLFREGETAKDFYVLLSGKLAVFRHRRLIQTISGRGTFVGEMGTLLGFTRSATIIAVEPTTALVIPARSDQLFEHHLPIAGKLVASLRRRLSETYDRAEKVWKTVFDEMVDTVVAEAATQVASRKGLTFDKVESVRGDLRKTIGAEMYSDTFELSRLGELLARLDVKESFERHWREKYPKFRPVNLSETRALWKKAIPERPADMRQHCLSLAAGLNELSEFVTALGIQDEDVGDEESALLEAAVPLSRRTALLRSIAQEVLTARHGIDHMKRLNRDIDTEIEEAGRNEQRTGRSYSLSAYSKKIEIGPEFVEGLRKEYWSVCSK